MPSSLQSSTAAAAADYRDDEVERLAAAERHRQESTIELVASENYAHPYVLSRLSSAFQNKYSEGTVGQRYYGGCENVDALESLCQQRALSLFDLQPDRWSVIVQSLSGSSANFAVYAALAGPGGKIMGLKLADGGHLTHGHPVSMTSKFFQSQQYSISAKDHLIDYNALEAQAMEFKPDIIVAGISAYCRELDYERFRQIADRVGCILMADMAHISGLVAGKALKNNPFDYCDVVTTTCHKSLRGPRSAMIFARKDHKDSIDTKIQKAHFPGLTGGPHNNKIEALVVALGMAQKPEFREYAAQCITNARTIASYFMEHGYEVLTGGTDVHMVLVNVAKNSKNGINGKMVQFVADKCKVSINMNSVVGDKSPFNPSGLRIGTPQITTRGLKESNVLMLCELLVGVIELTESIKQSLDAKQLPKATFELFCKETLVFNAQIKAMAEQCQTFIVQFPIY